MNDTPSPRELILADTERCVRCGTCKAPCPTYAQETVEPLSARGRVILVRGLLRGELKPSQLLADRLMSCLLCGLCEPLCPVQVKVTRAVYEALPLLSAYDRRGGLMKSLTRMVFQHPLLAWRLGRPFAALSSVVTPFSVSLPKLPLRKSVPRSRTPQGKLRGRVALFTGCAVNFVYPASGHALLRILEHMGYEVLLPAGEVCCGAPLRAMGQAREARAMALRNVEAFSNLGVEAVLSLCPTCTLTIGEYYGDMCGSVIKGAQDATAFIARHMDMLTVSAAAPAEDVSYHDPCHLRAGLGITREPRALLEAVGMRVRGSSAACCGFSQSMNFAHVSEGLLEGCSRAYGQERPLVSACPGCIAQLGREHGNVRHVVELVAEKISDKG